jgi:hypothetical protein
MPRYHSSCSASTPIDVKSTMADRMPSVESRSTVWTIRLDLPTWRVERIEVYVPARQSFRSSSSAARETYRLPG